MQVSELKAILAECLVQARIPEMATLREHKTSAWNRALSTECQWNGHRYPLLPVSRFALENRVPPKPMPGTKGTEGIPLRIGHVEVSVASGALP